MATRLAHPSCTVARTWEGNTTGVGVRKKGKEAALRKRRMHAPTQPQDGHAAILAASHAPTAFGLSRPSSLNRLTRASASKEALRSLRWQHPRRSTINVWPWTSSAAARMQKTPFRHPSHSMPVQTSPTQPPTCVPLLADPQGTAVQVLGNNPRSPRDGHLDGPRHRPRLRLLPLTQPTELPVVILGSRRGHAPGSIVPPESAGERNQAGDNPSRCAGCWLVGWLAGWLVVGRLLYIACISLHHAAALLPCSYSLCLGAWGVAKGNLILDKPLAPGWNAFSFVPSRSWDWVQARRNLSVSTG